MCIASHTSARWPLRSDGMPEVAEGVDFPRERVAMWPRSAEVVTGARPQVRVGVWLRRTADVVVDDELLDAHERERLASLGRPEDQESYAAGHVLLRRAVADVLHLPPLAVMLDRTCPDCGAPHGLPRLSEPSNLHVSLSRTRSHVAAAVAAMPVGVDIEQVDNVGFAGFGDVALHPREVRHVEGEPHGRSRRRAAAWVRKEAALKCLGVGLRVDPRSVCSPPSGVPVEILSAGTWITVEQLSTPWPQVAAAVAVAGSCEVRVTQN